MATVLLIIHSLLAVALIGVVLLQRSEGGALGMGGGGGGGGFMTGRGTANFLTRATAGLAAGFFATSLILSIMASAPQGQSTILDTKEGAATGQPKSGTAQERDLAADVRWTRRLRRYGPARPGARTSAARAANEVAGACRARVPMTRPASL
jgi:preprotein translocase subunit SecG